MRRIQVLFAGAVAQTLGGTKIDPRVTKILFDSDPPHNTAAHDFAKLKELMRVWIAIRYPNATYDEFTKRLAKADKVLSNSAAKIVIKEAVLIHEVAHAIMQAHQRAGRPKEFTFTKDQLDNLPAVKQRFP